MTIKMKNKTIVRLNPALQKVIEDTKIEMAKTFKMEPINIRGFNQIAQQKVAEWAKMGKQFGNGVEKKVNGNGNKAGANQKFSQFMDEITGI